MARLPAPSIRVRWILAVIIVGGLLAVGFTYNNRLKAEQSELLASIALSNKTIDMFRAIDLTPLKAQVADLETKAKNAENREASLTQRYRGYSHSIEIEERLYRAATEADVIINSVACAGPKNEEDGGIQFESYLVDVEAEADVPPRSAELPAESEFSFPVRHHRVNQPGGASPPRGGYDRREDALTFQIRVVFIPQEAA